MGQLPATTLGTSNPLDLCQGFPLFPAVGSLTTGFTQGQSITVGDSDANVTGSAIQVVGVCGPAYAVSVQIEGSNGGDVSCCNFTMQSQAGLTWGWTMTMAVQANFSVDPFPAEQTEQMSLTVDLLQQALNLLLKWLDEKNETALQQVSDTLPGVASAWGLFSNGTVVNEVQALEPVLSLPINILPLIPDLGEALEEASDVGISIAAGPEFALTFPTQIALQSASWDGLSGSPFGQISGGDCTGLPTWLFPSLPDPATTGNDDLKVTVGYDVGLGVEIGVFAEASFEDIASVGDKYLFTFDIPGMQQTSSGSNSLTGPKGSQTFGP